MLTSNESVSNSFATNDGYILVIGQEPETIFGQAFKHDAAKLICRATASKKPIKLSCLTRLLQQRFARLTMKKCRHLINQCGREGLLN